MFALTPRRGNTSWGLPLRAGSALWLAVSLMLVIPATVQAQGSPHGHWVSDPAGIATPGFVYDLPPAGFNPLSASDSVLRDWGFPPRPSSVDPVAYARWQKMVGSKWVTARLRFTGIYNGPARNLRVQSSVGNTTDTTSQNWSGWVISPTTDLFSTNSTSITGSWAAPAVLPWPLGATCSSATYATSQWVGFDGFTSSDVLQAGTQTNCGNSAYFWYEWYPNAETEVDIGLLPGHFVGVSVYYDDAALSSSPGYAVLCNDTTDACSSVGFSPPAGTTYAGNSAEWIVERPEVNGVLADLPNYGDLVMAQAYGDVPGTGGYSATKLPTGTTLYEVSMTCPPWNPSSECTGTTEISVPSQFGVLSEFGTVTGVESALSFAFQSGALN